MLLWVIGILLLSYTIGCLHGSVLAQWISGINLKQVGWKNAGASNATFVLGKRFGALVALIDIGKGIIAIGLIRVIAMAANLPFEWHLSLLFLAGGAVVFGHIFPFYMDFNGGKGTATFIGVLLTIDWQFGLIAFLLFVIVTWQKDILVYGVFMLYLTFLTQAIWSMQLIPIVVASILTVTAIIKHLENLKRIREGTETRVSTVFKKTS